MAHSRQHTSASTLQYAARIVCGFLLAVFVVQQVAVLPAAAQTINIVDETAPSASPETSASPTSNTVPSPSPESNELANLREKYRSELSIYRTDERNFQIAREQYVKLQTLAALESSVQATRKVMLSRTAVLQTYLQILKMMVSNTSGIDITEKSKLLQEIDTAIDRLKSHQKLVEQAIDRNTILNSVTDFNLFYEDVQNIAYKSLSYIAYGRLQTVYDKTVAVKGEVLGYIEEQEKNGLRLGEKRRGLEETDRSLASTRARLDTVRMSFQPRNSGQETQFDANGYGRTVQELGAIYGDLYRNLSFLREVIKS